MCVVLSALPRQTIGGVWGELTREIIGRSFGTTNERVGSCTQAMWLFITHCNIGVLSVLLREKTFGLIESL